MAGKGDTDRGHSRENYDHIFRKEECVCEECKTKIAYAKRVTNYKGDKQNAMQEGQ